MVDSNSASLDCETGILPQSYPESGSIPLRNWIFLLIPSPNPGIGIELELPSFELELESELRSSELNSELPFVPHISVAYYSRRLAQVVYTLLVHIDSTKEMRLEDSFVVHTTKKL